jgi:hypothetical protein
MNQDLLQKFYNGLETLMRERRQLLARRVLAVESKASVAAFPLTPALSLGERENCSQAALWTGAPQPSPALSFGLKEAADEAKNILNVESRALLFPLPTGEGQGEGKAAIQREMGGTSLRPAVSGVPPESVVGRELALAAANNHHGNISDEIRRDAGFDGRDARATCRRSSPK